MHLRPRCYSSVCNCVFVLRADTNVCGLFCICVFVSIKGLTVISEVAKGNLASVIILFTSIMELNIEEGDSWEQTHRHYFNPSRLIFSSSGRPGATENHSVRTGEALAEEPTQGERSGEPV